MQCWVYLRVLIFIALCQPSLHLDRVENGRESLRDDSDVISFLRNTPRKIRSDFSVLEREEPNESLNKRSFWSRPIAKTQNRRSPYVENHRHNEPHNYGRRTAAHRSIESDEYHTHEKGKNQYVSADYAGATSNGERKSENRCRRRQKQQKKFQVVKKVKRLLNAHKEYLSDAASEMKDTRKRRFRDEEREERTGANHRRNIESETFLGGEETIQDGQKMLLDSFRRRKRTGEGVGKSRWRRKKKKKKKRNERFKGAKEERRTARTEFRIYGDKGNADLVNNENKETADRNKRLKEKFKKMDGSKQDFEREYLKNMREKRKIIDDDDFRRLRRQTEEQKDDGNLWENNKESSDKDNAQEMGSDMNQGGIAFETDEYEQDNFGEENELAENAKNNRKKKESEMRNHNQRLEYSNGNAKCTREESKYINGKPVNRGLWNDKMYTGKKRQMIFKTEGKYPIGSQKNSGNKNSYTEEKLKMRPQSYGHGQQWDHSKRSRLTENEFPSDNNRESEKKDKERRRWVYINNVYPNLNPRAQKKKVKSTPLSVSDGRRARRVHRKLPEMKEFMSDEDAMKEEAEWDKEYAIVDAEEADRDHRQAEIMQAEAEVQELEQEQEKMGEDEMEQGPEMDEERRGLRESELEHQKLEKGSEETEILAPRHQRTDLEARVSKYSRHDTSANVLSGSSSADKIRWNVISLLALGLLVFTLR
uniref:Trichohyalin-like n=1 Tax=Strigamia maritima TaxID=126957 RepID=T1J5G4_STRMM